MGCRWVSGVVESAAVAVVADRLKRGGMRWTVAGVNAMLGLAVLDPRRPDDFQPADARSPPLAAADRALAFARSCRTPDLANSKPHACAAIVAPVAT